MTNTNYYSEIFAEVLVFKTNIATSEEAKKIGSLLSALKEVKTWNVDREDIDNVLRIESENLSPATIIRLVNEAGFECEELPD